MRRTASALWSSVNWARRLAARRSLTRPVALDARVVAIGNIQAGGSGKTPLVALAANEARARGLRVCILTRGYRGSWEKSGGVIAPAEAGDDLAKPAGARTAPGACGPAPDVRDCGDEAALLHELCPAAWIGVGADRLAQFRKARALAGKLDLVLLDDGFQNFRIRKDVEIIAVTGAARARTLHRDWSGQLRHADLVVHTKGPPGPPAQAEVRFRLPRAPEGTLPLWLVTAVGSPEQVRESASEAGYTVRTQIALADHADVPRERALAWLSEARAKGCQLALTGKDWVKWRRHGIAREEVLVLEPSLEFVRGRERWERALWG